MVGTGNYTTQNCFVHPNSLTSSTEVLNLQFWSDDSSNERENKISKKKKKKGPPAPLELVVFDL